MGFYTRAAMGERLKATEKELVDYVAEYFARWRKPIPLYKLSYRFGRQLRCWGSTLRMSCDHLQKKDMIAVTLTESGAYVVAPGTACEWDRKGWRSKRA